MENNGTVEKSHIEATLHEEELWAIDYALEFAIKNEHNTIKKEEMQLVLDDVRREEKNIRDKINA